ncbi:MAG: glucokinase [Gemmatimonadaceae bacterium]
MILACDVGGTKTDLALFESDGTTLRQVRRQTFRSQEHGALHEIVTLFMGQSPLRLEAAGFGVAGPVHAGHVKTTNLPWTVDGARLARVLGLGRVSLLNDVEAQAWSALRLTAGEQLALQAGTPDSGNIAVIAAGTGLGCAALIRGDGPVRSLASEGGHADFAPSDDAEIELLGFLRGQYGRVSVERVVSGPGLFKIYEFLREKDPGAEPGWLAEALQKETDPTATVARAALDGSCPLAEKAVLFFLGSYGAEAGNWALRTLAVGGVWLGGGIARKLFVGPSGTSDAWRKRAREAFLNRFRDKGRLSPLLEATAVQVVISDQAALMGAACFAFSEVGNQSAKSTERKNEKEQTCESD